MAGTPSGGPARFSCPPSFTATPPASEPPRFSLEAVTSPDTELWLIQTPADFTPNCLNGRLVPLSGSQVVKGKLAGKRHRYRVLSSSCPGGEVNLLAPSAEAGGGLTCAPAPQGNLRIFEGPKKSLSGTSLQTIPASPAPQIPAGLRPRFCAFGGSPPVTGLGSPSGKKKKKRHLPEASVPQQAVNGHGSLQVDAALGSSEMDVGKKKKKQRQEELEVMEAGVTKPGAEMLEPLGVLFPTTTKKRKKKPKEAEVMEPEEKRVELELMVKSDPLEETALTPTKKRQQKGTEGMEPVEGVAVESQLQVKMEPQVEAIPQLVSKKKKKEKGQKMMVEPETGAMGLEMSPQELQGAMVEPDLLQAAKPQVEAALSSTRKRRKKEKWQNAMAEPGPEVVEPELPGDLEPQAALGSTKKKGKGHKVTEAGTEMAGPQEEMVVLEPPGESEQEARAEPVSRGEMPEPLLNSEPGEAVPTRREKKRKRLQQDPM